MIRGLLYHMPSVDLYTRRKAAFIHLISYVVSVKRVKRFILTAKEIKKRH